MNKENHHEYTLLAIELYEKFNKMSCVPQNTFLPLAQGVWDEDEYHVFTLDLQRLMNWHFYNNKNRIFNSKLVPGERTSENRVHELTRKVLKEKQRYTNSLDESEKKDNLEHLLTSTGRLIHHIQDMSTFSHVVPVYHGPGLKDSYEEYGLGMHGKIKVSLDEKPKDDRFYIIFSSDELQGSCHSQSECIEDKLFDIYRFSAEETLRILKDEKYGFSITSNQSDTEPKKRTWSCFWKEEDDIKVDTCPTIENKHQGFGSFGELCNNFGKGSFNVGHTLYKVDEGDYLQIYKLLMKKSIKDTISTLSLVLADLQHS